MGAQDSIRSSAGGLSQRDLRLKLDTPLAPRRVVGGSRLGRHFDCTFDVVSTTSGVELKTVIGRCLCSTSGLTS